jgi:hypothetical protein
MRVEHLHGAHMFSAAQEFLKQRRVDHAIDLFHRAEKLGFDASECASARWDCWMLSGRFERAWEESEAIARTGVKDPHRFWDGRPWAGKRVMLRCLHGLGDTIQFIRYAPLIRESAKSLVVQVHPELVTLIGGIPGIDRAITWGESVEPEPDDWEVQMEVTELPRAFRTTAHSLPSAVPYIRVPDERIAWASRLVGPADGLRIGIVWQSGPYNPARSISLDCLKPIFCSGRHKFYSLQKGVDVRELRDPPPVLDVQLYTKDVQDTAALMLNLDLMVSVDTMTAHLAGALGKPVWILLPFDADWRWMLERSDTPWYPTARLFRQSRPGDWSDMVETIAERLRGR